MRLSEELARILPGPFRRMVGVSEREVVTVAAPANAGAEPHSDDFDAAHERLKSQIAPIDDED